MRYLIFTRMVFPLDIRLMYIFTRLSQIWCPRRGTYVQHQTPCSQLSMSFLLMPVNSNSCSPSQLLFRSKASDSRDGISTLAECSFFPSSAHCDFRQSSFQMRRRYLGACFPADSDSSFDPIHLSGQMHVQLNQYRRFPCLSPGAAAVHPVSRRISTPNRVAALGRGSRRWVYSYGALRLVAGD
jgi:hypothetical protein